MDQATERRWRAAQPPFDGVTVYTDLLPTPALLMATVALLDVVERCTTCRNLRTFEDWHEHDGYVKEGAAGTWNDLRSSVRDERALREASPEDDYVRRAWLAEDGSFYLRWHWYRAEPAPAWLPESGDPAEGGDVDLTGSQAIVQLAAESLAELGIDPHQVAADAFFASRWAG